MYDRIALKLAELMLGLKREDGQGATEYAMVIAFLIVLLVGGLGILGVGINKFLADVAKALPVVGP
jgi:Flp pilus assembly pilin Flp